jgi:hypothetical protein
MLGSPFLSEGDAFKRKQPVEIIYFIGAFVLLPALIYGTLHSHFSNRRFRKASDQIVRDRYERNQA